MTGIVAGKVAIVTGAGAASAAASPLLAQEGARVVVCDIGASLEGAGADAGPAQQVVEEIRNGGGEAIASTLSIAEPGNADEIVQAALTAFGRVDILVNNAGILRDRIFHRMSWSDWSDVLAVHLNGSFNMSRACALRFREQNSGAFVHMTSTSALVGNFGQANYMAAKFGIVGLSRGDRARHAALRGALQLHRAVRLDADDRFNSGRNGGGESARRALPADDAGEDRAARGLSRFRPGRGHFRADIRGAQQRGLPVQPAAAGADHPSVRRLDPGQARTSSSRERSASSFTPLERSTDVFSWDPV